MRHQQLRVRPQFTRISLTIFVILVPFVLNAAWDFRETRRFRLRVDAIHARGEPLSAKPTMAKPLDPHSAEAERLYRAASSLAIDGVVDPIAAPVQVRIRSAAREGVWPPDLLELMRGQVQRYAEALGFVDRAASLPFDNFLPGTDSRLQPYSLQKLATLADWRAVLESTSGKTDVAVQSLISEARLGRAMSRPPVFAGLRTVLRHGTPTETARVQFMNALGALDRDDYLKQQFLLTRSSIIDDYATNPIHWWSLPLRAFSTRQRVRQLDDYARLVAAAEQPWPERIEAVIAIGTAPGSGRHSVTDQESLRGVVMYVANITRSIRCARLLVAGGQLRVIDPFTGETLSAEACERLP